MNAPNEEKSDYSKDSIYEELELSSLGEHKLIVRTQTGLAKTLKRISKPQLKLVQSIRIEASQNMV